jgi:hypothetical protein
MAAEELEIKKARRQVLKSRFWELEGESYRRGPSEESLL